VFHTTEVKSATSVIFLLLISMLSGVDPRQSPWLLPSAGPKCEADGEVAGIATSVRFNENAVQGTARPSMLIRMLRFLSRARKSACSELRALIGVPDFGLAEAEAWHRVSPGKSRFPSWLVSSQLSTKRSEPIHDGHQVTAATAHWKDISVLQTWLEMPRATGTGRSRDPALGGSSAAEDLSFDA
jgi:hypothetical protein